jgi:hypothetical protein
VKEFFEVLGNIVDNYKLVATSIFNIEETAFSTVHKPQKIFALPGKYQVGAITSGERGIKSTCLCCMCAARDFVPPILIFKRLRFEQELSEGDPPGTKLACTKSGWITSEVFVQWLKHFTATVKPSKNKNVLIVLDRHSTHTENLEVIELARENGVLLISIPAHTTHQLQPLDISFLNP